MKKLMYTNLYPILNLNIIKTVKRAAGQGNRAGSGGAGRRGAGGAAAVAKRRAGSGGGGVKIRRLSGRRAGARTAGRRVLARTLVVVIN